MNTNVSLPAIEAYKPFISDATWQAAGDFARSTIVRYSVGRTPSNTMHALIVLTGYLDWVQLNGVCELDDAALDADVIDAFTAHRVLEVEPAVAARERKILRAVAGHPASIERASTFMTNASPTAPYTREEQGWIRRWAETQRSESRRVGCMTGAALGLGCGLTSAEMLAVRGKDLTVLADGMVGVQLQTRLVPVTAEWHDELASRVGTDPDEHLVHPRSARRHSTSLARYFQGNAAHFPSTQKMRVTWMVAHLNGGTPVNSLLEAAGISSDALRRLLPYVTRLKGAAHVEALRLNGEVVR